MVECDRCGRAVNDHNPAMCCRKHGLPVEEPGGECRQCVTAKMIRNECCGLSQPYHSAVCSERA